MKFHMRGVGISAAFFIAANSDKMGHWKTDGHPIDVFGSVHTGENRIYQFTAAQLGVETRSLGNVTGVSGQHYCTHCHNIAGGLII